VACNVDVMHASVLGWLACGEVCCVLPFSLGCVACNVEVMLGSVLVCLAWSLG